jgi:glycosyltransferase involved in cell wall biosynthesis
MNEPKPDSDMAVRPGEHSVDVDDEDQELLTVIVPCLNEEQTVRETAESIYDLAPDLPVDVEILFIDDGSTDGTLGEMERFCREHPECDIMVNDQNLGLGRSVLNAYERIDPASWATVMPGDNELIFRSIENFLEVRDEYDIILGYLKNPIIRPFPRRVGSEAFTAFANLLYGFSFRYFNGMKLYRVGCFQGIEVEANGHAFNPELLAKAVLRDPAIRIGEVPFMTKGRSHGNTKAFQVSSMVEAVRDVYAGYKSVIEYREQVIHASREQ